MSHRDIQIPEALRNNYIYLRSLNEGSGKIWLAKDLHSEESVVIKVINGLSSYEAVEQLQHEIEKLKSVHVRGVPKYYNLVQASSPELTSYLIQEYIPYPSLQSYLDKGQIFSERDVLNILYYLGEILHELQDSYPAPILHRDIKPSNILYNPMHDRVEVFLVDFAVLTDISAGTYGYMAPEALLCKSTIQTDYYALGATAVHLLCGIPPYDMACVDFRLKFEDTLMSRGCSISLEFYKLLFSLLDPNISGRPANADELMASISKFKTIATPEPHIKTSLWRRLFHF